MKNYKKRTSTLKSKIIKVLFLCGISGVTAIVLVSYMTIRMVSKNSIQNGMKGYLSQITNQTDTSFYTMIRIGNQMSAQGYIGNMVERYMSQTEAYDIYISRKELHTELIALDYTNDSLQGVTYYDVAKNKSLIDEANAVKLTSDYRKIPGLVESVGNNLQPAHPSLLNMKDKLVTSLYRRENFGRGQVLDIYIEMLVNLSQDNDYTEEWPYDVVQMDCSGIVCYSSNENIIQGEQLITREIEKESYCFEEKRDYYLMAYRSKIGYINALILPDDIYRRELVLWRNQMFFIVAVTFGVFMASALYLYRLIYRPLNTFQKQMVRIGQGERREISTEFGITEFNVLMDEFNNMQEQVDCLIIQMLEEEKCRQKTEYEKLVYQINPHFLLNTLNSVQWMAQMNHQEDISQFVYDLKALLAYNLGKEGRETTLRSEVMILKRYLKLQQKRYDFAVKMEVEEGRYLDMPTVRMLLQPLVENAIRYGLGEEEIISIQILEDSVRHMAIIMIVDSGKGLSQEELHEINKPFGYKWDDGKQENKGIGFRYVKAMLETFYNGDNILFVNSERGKGTKITILLPIPDELKV